MKRPNRRTLILTGLGLVILGVLAFSLRSPASLVDTATVKRDHFQITVEEEGRTRLPDRYRVAAPMAGHLNRVLLEPGDSVEQGQELFSLNPAAADALDARSRAQAEASLARAESALSSAQAQIDVAQARNDLAQTELERVRRLVASDHLPREQLDRAQAEARGAQANLQSARFGVEVARHERANAEAVLNVAGGAYREEPLAINSPISGIVLQRERQSEGRVQAGEVILTLGDLNRLQVEVDLLSQDAVRLRPGMRVELERWGGDQALPARVRRVEPAGFTHISALGVEEQRVWVIVDFEQEREHWQALGDGYRVEARFVVWEDTEVLQAPASALFREGDTWATYVLENNRAVRREVEPGQRSGLMAEIRSGLEPGERVILHPGQDLTPGTRVQTR